MTSRAEMEKAITYPLGQEIEVTYRRGEEDKTARARRRSDDPPGVGIHAFDGAGPA